MEIEFRIFSLFSPITSAALRPVTATAVWVLLLSLAARSQLPQSLVCSTSSMTTDDVMDTGGDVCRLATSDDPVIFGGNGRDVMMTEDVNVS